MTSLIPIADTEALRAAGISYPSTEHSWRWLYRQRHERGLAGAFRRVGKRVLVDTEEYVRLVRAQAAT